MRSLVIISLAASLGLLYGCERSGIETSGTGKTPEITLDHCTNLVVAGNSVRVCFDSVLSESRCPIGAVCVWQGYAAGKFSFTANGETHPLRLSTIDFPHIFPKDTMVAGYKIEFIDLKPYPNLSAPPPPTSQIKAEIKITKL